MPDPDAGMSNRELADDSVESRTLAADLTLGGTTTTTKLVADTLFVNSVELGASQIWTPTLTNLTIGNGLVVAFFSQVGKVVFLQAQITLGSTSSMSTGPRLSLPVEGKTTTWQDDDMGIGSVIMLEKTVRRWMGTVQLRNTTTIEIVNHEVQGDVIALEQVSSATPFTWAADDALGFTAHYLAA